MTSTSVKQNLICLVIILLVALAVGWAGQKPDAAPTGLLSLNDNTEVSKEPYSPNQVDIYQAIPPGTKVIGEITAELAFDKSENEQTQIKALLNYVRKLAADAGVKAIAVEILAERGDILYFSGHLLSH